MTQQGEQTAGQESNFEGALFGPDTPVLETSSSRVYGGDEVIDHEPEGDTTTPEGDEGQVGADTGDAGQGGDGSNQEPQKPAVDWETRYRNLEAIFSRQANELGEMRKQLHTRNDQQARAEENILDDPDFDFSDPANRKRYEAAILNKAEQRTGARIDFEKSMLSLSQRHPDREQVVSTVEFQAFLGTLPEHLVTKGTNDPVTTSFILDLYKGRSNPQPGQQQAPATTEGSSVDAAVTRMQTRKTAAKSAAGLGGSAASRDAGSGKTFKSSELVKMQLDRPEEYERLQPEIMKAYREGRVI